MPDFSVTLVIPSGAAITDTNAAIKANLGPAWEGSTNTLRGHEFVRLTVRELVKRYRLGQDTTSQTTYDTSISAAQDDIDAANTTRSAASQTIKDQADTDFDGA